MDSAERKQAGVSDGLIRLAVGLESLDDLLEDLDRALTKGNEKPTFT
jgi:cystathionine beta-lyase/cystathionine gamma-synthase